MVCHYKTTKGQFYIFAVDNAMHASNQIITPSQQFYYYLGDTDAAIDMNQNPVYDVYHFQSSSNDAVTSSTSEVEPYEIITDENFIEMTNNEVYGIRTDGIETTPNVVYGIRADGIETTANDEVYGIRTVSL